MGCEACNFAKKKGNRIICEAPRNLRVVPQETTRPGIFATVVKLLASKEAFCDYPSEDFPAPDGLNCPLATEVLNWQDYIEDSQGQPTIQKATDKKSAKNDMKYDPPQTRTKIQKRK